jgi:prevent-host-death family protein
MQYVSVRDFRIRPRDVWNKLKQGDVVVTSSGSPVAVLVSVEAEELEETLLALRRARAQLSVSRMRRAAASAGVDRLTEADIEQEIQQAHTAQT